MVRIPFLSKVRHLASLDALCRACLCLAILYGACVGGVVWASTGLNGPDLPGERGEVVFTRSGKSGRHLYIIGQSHRSARDGSVARGTVAAQADVYRLGQWLIQNEDVELFLPEGFFETRTMGAGAPRAHIPGDIVWMDETTLERRLSDTGSYTNACKLLYESRCVLFRQVEDENLYFQALDLVSSNGSGGGLEGLADELEWVQERRSAAMLQNAARVVEEEFEERRIVNPRAVLTVGLAHLDEILRFLQEERIRLASRRGTTQSCAADDTELALFSADFGVTVIVPASLWKDEKALQVTRLEHLKL